MYYCNIQTCEDNKEQKLYCMQCIIDEGKHSTAHKNLKRVTIKEESFRIQDVWKSVVSCYKELIQEISEPYTNIQPLVTYLDGEALLNTNNLSVKSPKHKISEDIAKFEREAKNIEKKNQELEELFEKKDLLGMLAMDVHLEHFKKVFSELEYLKMLANCDETEQLLYDIYEGTLQIAGTSTRKFKDFTP